MLIYADHKKEYKTSDIIRNLNDLLTAVGESAFSNNLINTELLIKFGEFESALTDKICGQEDTYNSVIVKLRDAALLAGHIFYDSSLPGKTDICREYAEKLQVILREISCSAIPDFIVITLPEGYAYYGLYPEMYIEAAQRFIGKSKPKEACVIGIRSIGTSLSAVVAACFEDQNCKVNSFTIRPRGDFFNRHIKLSNELKSVLLLKNKAEVYYIIVDEGPGLSATSFCSLAEYLSGQGIPDNKIVFFPSWNPDASSFVSDMSKKVWIKHEKYTVSFEDALLDKGKLKSHFAYDSLYDISAGKWRELFYKNETDRPAVYQNLEQRKYICSENSGKSFFIKFAGLGYCGLKLFNRAVKLYEAGFSPRAYDVRYGFIIFDLIRGIPLRKEEVNQEILDRFVAYLVFLKNTFPSKPSTSPKELKEMIRINILKGMGEQWAGRSEKGIDRHITDGYENYSVAIDGRMLPYEWLKTDSGLIKTDSIHHHTGHLLPGSIDAAWDIAGTIVEFQLKENMRSYFLSKYALAAGDAGIKERLNFFLIAYLAFRLGYTKFACERLGESPDGLKFRNLFMYYSSMLKDIL